MVTHSSPSSHMSSCYALRPSHSVLAANVCSMADTPICRYAESAPLLSARLVSLVQDFPEFRRIAGDGNCFYRAFLFGLLEHVLCTPSPTLCSRLHRRCTELLADLRRLADDGTQTFSREMLASSVRGCKSIIDLLSQAWFLPHVNDPTDIAGEVQFNDLPTTCKLGSGRLARWQHT